MIAPFQQQAIHFWQKQSKPQRITLIVLVLAAVIVVPLLISWSTTPSYAVVFSGLSESDAGQIVQKLQESNIPYQLRDASTVMVPSNQVYEVRLMMARDGIPQSSTVGFDVFANNTLGMTEFTQRVNYQQALQGELERTIASLDSIESARVHVVTPEESLFSSQQPETTASVTLKVKAGQQVDVSQVNAITHLVAYSVEGMKPENVVVVDTNGKMLTSAAQDSADMSSLTEVNSHSQVEQQAAQSIQQKVQSMLDSVLGPNHSTVQASVAMDWSQKETTSQTFNPTPAAVRSSHVINEAYTLDGSTGGIPGASSNLPTPVATVTVEAGATLYQKTEETYNYEITQTQSKEVLAPGKIDRISLSVMVDNVSDAAQMTVLKNAVIAAAGIDTTRGDTVSVESMAFDHSLVDQQQAAQTQMDQTNQTIQMAEYGAALLGAFILVVIVLSMFGKLRKSAGEQWRPVMRSVSELALAAGLPHTSGMQVPQLGSPNEAQPAALTAGGERSSSQQVQNRIMELVNRNSISPEDEQIQKMMGKVTDDSPATVAEIIQMWLNEE